MSDPTREVQDPTTSAARLAELASSNRELAAWISIHPNCYPELRQWIATYVPAAVQPQVHAPIAHDPYAAAQQPADPYAAAQPVDPHSNAQPANPYASTQPTIPYANAQLPAGARARPRRRGLVLWISIGAAVVLMLSAGGFAWWYFGSRLGGAASPEAAVTKLISGAQSLDPIALYGSFSPSEVGLLQTSFEQLTQAQTPDDSVDVQQLIGELRAAVSVTADDLEFETEPLADGVSRVTWIDGSIEIDGDPEAIAEIAIRAYGPTMRSTYESLGNYSDEEIDALIADSEQSLAESMELPYVLDADDIRDSSGLPLALVTAQEGSGWFISPMLTQADLSYRYAEQSGYSELGRLGNEVVDAYPFGTPDEAATALTEAIVAGDIDGIAASLPLAERRYVSIYGDALYGDMIYGEYGALTYNAPTLERAEFSSDVQGDRARVEIDDLTLTTTTYQSDLGYDLTDSFTLNGVCADWVNQYAYDDGYYDEGTYWYETGEWIESWVADEDSGSGCLDDVPVFDRLGASDVSIIAVREGGGWLISPTATVADAAAIMTGNFLDYYENDRIDELFR